MKKADRISAFVETLGAPAPAAAACSASLDPHYAGFFQCFNEGRYYEAHDVLEHLWLRNGRADANHLFFKGLIQIAGAFVHLRKQFLRPAHPTDGRRLRPAARLFLLGMGNIGPYGARHMSLDIAALRALCAGFVAEIRAGDFARNPWHPDRAPQIRLLSESDRLA